MFQWLAAAFLNAIVKLMNCFVLHALQKNISSSKGVSKHICDMIKQSQALVGHIQF